MGAIGGLPDAGAEPVVLGVGVPHVGVAHRCRLLPPLSFPAAAREVERERERERLGKAATRSCGALYSRVGGAEP
jgi:hypothetical protein